MKASTATLIASAVVLASSIYAHPILLKRAANVVDAVACITPILLNPASATQSAISACQAKLTQDIGLIKGATVASLQFDLTGASPTIATNDISVELMSFPGITSIPVSRTKLNDGTTNTGSFASVWLATTPKGFSFDMSLSVTPLTITAEQTPAFIALLSALATTASHTIVLDGTADVDLSVSIASALNAIPNPVGAMVPAAAPKVIPLTGLAITAPITLKGFNNFGGVAQGHLDSISTLQTSATGVRSIHGQVTVTSPSDISVTLGDIDFQLWTKDAQPVYLGIASVASLSLVPGAKTYDVIVTVDAAVQLDQYFPVKSGLTLTVKGFAGSSKNPIAAGVVAAVQFDLVF
ncbi:hypothetical protein EMPS_11134 [Entomortierella parvispora]|uniref:Uncharacterized protein n=1 Tax=Entomortierella parvispora TaxID=205924 RepID=A0A9P3M275_9FUNG|nr:hypothetical protein EMPS_11134 [Entomortierella parvispora]